MKTKILLLTVFSFVIFTAEKCEEKVVETAEAPIEKDADKPEEITAGANVIEFSQPEADTATLKSVNTAKDYQQPKETDPFTVESIEIQDSILFITVSYGGGCEEHEFTLNSNLRYMKSLPAQLGLFLEHDAKGDACRAMLFKTLQFNVSAVKYGESGNELILRFNNTDKTVRYSY